VEEKTKKRKGDLSETESWRALFGFHLKQGLLDEVTFWAAFRQPGYQGKQFEYNYLRYRGQWVSC
jgi:hypothetical protein